MNEFDRNTREQMIGEIRGLENLQRTVSAAIDELATRLADKPSSSIEQE